MALPLSRRASLGAITLFVAAVLCASGCHPRITDPHDPNFIVAQKDDWTITRAQLDHEIDNYLKEHQITVAQVGAANMPALETFNLRNMVAEKLLLARAATRTFKDVDKDDAAAFQRIKDSLPSEAAFQDKLKTAGITEDDLKKRIHEQVLIEKLFEAEALHDTEPTDKDVNDFYMSHKDYFNVPLKLRASEVLVLVPDKATPAQTAAKRKIIDQARARIVRGEDFSKVATTVSEDRYSAPKGGDTGYFQRGENPPGFDEVAFASKVGVLSPVFQTPLGFEFLKVTDIKPAGLLPIDDARGAIVQHLRQTKIQQDEENYTIKLVQDGKVQYNIPLTEPPADATAPVEGNGAPPPDGSEAPSAAPDAAAPTNAAPSGP
jgi:peptidyl-prolyl cis-trans isomerase C